jgi:prephenate dehydratase
MKSMKIAVVLFVLLGLWGNTGFASVCYIGSAGSAVEKAVIQFVGAQDNVLPAANYTEAVSMVKTGKCGLAVIPVEAAAGGLIYDNLDALLADETLAVVGEVKMPASQSSEASMTRFWVITSAKNAAQGGDTAIASVRGSVNSVIKLASELVQMGYKVQALHDRPIKDKLGEYQFVIEVSGLNPKYTLERLIVRPDLALQGEILGSFDAK